MVVSAEGLMESPINLAYSRSHERHGIKDLDFLPLNEKYRGV